MFEEQYVYNKFKSKKIPFTVRHHFHCCCTIGPDGDDGLILIKFSILSAHIYTQPAHVWFYHSGNSNESDKQYLHVQLTVYLRAHSLNQQRGHNKPHR